MMKWKERISYLLVKYQEEDIMIPERQAFLDDFVEQGIV